jgi:hypothetical protein
MIIVALEALAGIAVSLSILMSLAWVVQQRTGNSGWVDTIWTFSVGLTGAGSALWDIGRSALCRLRERVGPRCAAQNVLVSAKPGVRIDPAGLCDFHRGAVSV